MSITEKNLEDLVVGIVKTQAAVIEALSENNMSALPKIHSRVGALVSQQASLKSLPAQLFLKALSTPGPTAPSLEQLAHQEFGRLLNKS